jgi:hypothetical protein
MAANGIVPFMKAYKDFVFAYRYDVLTFVGDNKKAMMINMFLTPTGGSVANKKSVDTTKKIDLKFDDGTPRSGNILGMCNPDNTTRQQYSGADTCPEVFFRFDLR